MDNQDRRSVGVQYHKAAPSPTDVWLQRARNKGPLSFLLTLTQEYGDVVQYSSAYGPIHLVNHPHYVGHVFQDKNYSRTRLLSLALGDGLITSEGAYWRSQRRLAQPAFHHQFISKFDALVTDAAIAMLRRWHAIAGTDQPVEVPTEMMRLTLGIIGNALFGVDLSGEAQILAEAITTIVEDLGRMGRTLFGSEYNVSPMRDRQFKTAMEIVDRIVYSIIDKRRRENNQAGDLLSRLLCGRDEETGEALSDRQLRDEAVTMLVAGHETTANMLAWTWYLLSEHPSIERRLQTELATVLEGRVPSFQDLPKLHYNRMVLQESLRLYPPVWFISPRTPLADDVIGGYLIPANSRVVVSPYAMHRHLSYWQNPEQFDPERFSPERSKGRPHYAFCPFGGGHHLCLGNNLAMMEGELILATIVQRYQLRLCAGHPVEPDPLVTLRHRYGLPMTLHARSTTNE